MDMGYSRLLILPGALLYCVAYGSEMDVGCVSDAEPASGSYPFSRQTRLEYAVPEGARIREVSVTRLPVFDETNPRENNALYRWGNRFHTLTREERVVNHLLFEQGDRYDSQVIEESARLLRDEKYLYDADVRPVSVCGNEVDVEVITRDVWSFTPEISFKRSGGENDYRLGIQEINLFGKGIELAARHKSDDERTENEFVYQDSNIAGSRLESRLIYSDNDDGSEAKARLRLPFFSLDSRRAWDISFEDVERTDTQYYRGDDLTEVQRDARDYMVKYGWSRGLNDSVAWRWSAGYRYQEQEYSPGDELPPPAAFPVDKTMSYAFFELQVIEDNFDVGVNLDQIHRTEDIQIGSDFRMSLGYAAEAFGSDQDRLVFSGGYKASLVFNSNVWLAHELDWEELYNFETSEPEDVMVDYELRYLREQTKHRSFFASFRGTWVKNLNTNSQLLYGGETGARAFDNRFQAGDRRVVLTLEERMYTDIHLFNLIRVGWAIFIDLGKAWEPGVDDGIEDDYLVSAGLGLRLSSSKSDRGSLLHIDLAFPLTNKDDPEVDSSQVAVRLKNRF